MKRTFSILLVGVIILTCVCPVYASDSDRRVQLVPCSESSTKISKVGNHLEIYKRFVFGSFPGDSYTVSREDTMTINTNASVNVLDAFLSMGVSIEYSTSSSIGYTVTNRGNSYSRAALWVSYDDYNVSELRYAGNGYCEVYKSTAKVPIYHIYGYENSY